MSISLEVETPRLVLRQWRADDRKPFAEMNADPRVTEFLLPLSAPESDALAGRLAAGIDEHGWGFWAVEAPGVAPFVGFVGIKPMPPVLPFAPGVEVGWRLAQPFWGRGYASEAALAALRVGFEQVGLGEIVAFTAVGNQPLTRGDGSPGHAGGRRSVRSSRRSRRPIRCVAMCCTAWARRNGACRKRVTQSQVGRRLRPHKGRKAATP